MISVIRNYGDEPCYTKRSNATDDLDKDHFQSLSLVI